MTTSADEQARLQRIEQLEQEVYALLDGRDRLALAQSRWQTLMDESPFGVVVYRPNGTVKAGGKGMQRLFGLSDEDADYAQTVYNILEDPQLAEKGLMDAVRKAFSGEPAELPCVQYELRGPIEDRNVTKWLEGVFFPVLEENGQVREVVAIQIDVSERMKVQAELQDSQIAMSESEQRLRQIAEHIREVVWRLDLEVDQMTYVSPAWESIWGRPIEELYARPERWMDDFHPNDQDRISEFVNRLATEGGNASLEARIVRPDGEIRWVAFRASTVQNEAGTVHRLVGTAEDITEAKLRDEEREQFESRMQQAQKLESLGLLAGGIAHDFNNLLMGVLGNADLALLSITPESPGHEYVERIQGAAQRASELANQMLAYSGKGRFLVGPLDLNRVLLEMRHLLESAISKKVQLEVDLADDLPPIEADASQVRQVIMNLITNASEAIGSKRGTARISTSLFDADNQYLAQCELGALLTPGQYVRIEVSDTGPGIGKEIRQNIFDPFFSTKFTGRGLGLAATLGIVQSHGAALRLSSNPTRGTTFSVLFPPSSAQLDPVIPKGPEPVREDPAKTTILVVDDEAIVRDVARAMLQNAKYNVRVASDGTEAVAIFEKESERIDLVLLDMAMPGMDGRETYEAMREIREDVLVVLSSGYTEEEAISKLGASGAVDFIQKPYKLDSLLDAVKRALGS